MLLITGEGGGTYLSVSGGAKSRLVSFVRRSWFLAMCWDGRPEVRFGVGAKTWRLYSRFSRVVTLFSGGGAGALWQQKYPPSEVSTEWN